MSQDAEDHLSFDERTQEAHANLPIVLEYLTERTEDTPTSEGHKPSEALISEAATLAAARFAELSTTQKARLWCLLDRLSDYLRPATIQGLRTTDRLKPTIIMPDGARRFMIALFAVTVILHGYALFGARAIERIDASGKELQEVQLSINQIQQARPELFFVDSQIVDCTREYLNTSEEQTPKHLTCSHLYSMRMQQIPAQLPLDLTASNNNIGASSANSKGTPLVDTAYFNLLYKQKAINNNTSYQYATLYQWNAPFGWALAELNGENPHDYWGTDCPGATDPTKCKAEIDEHGRRTWPASAQVHYGSEHMARALHEFLQVLLLPVLYSMLGGCVWIIRERLRRTSERNLIPMVGGQVMQRVLLAGVMGGVVGVFWSSNAAPISGLKSIPLIGLAFLVGYNVELVFAALDKLICNVRSHLQAKTP